MDTQEEKTNDVTASGPQTIQHALMIALSMMRDGRAIGGRNWAVALTDLEKVYAYWVHYVQTSQDDK